MLSTIILLPLLSFICAGCAGHWIGRSKSMHLTTFSMGVNLCIIVALFVKILQNNANYFINAGSWIDNGLLIVDWTFYIDNLTATMLIVVSGVSFLVHLYSTGYMVNDPHVTRFMSYLSLFTFFMIVLISGDNIILLFLGWEGVGLCSYLLISFWFTRIQANKSAIKALVVNRISDFALTMVLCVLLFTLSKLKVFKLNCCRKCLNFGL